MFHIHIFDEQYWELRNECSELMGKWFLQLPLKIKIFLIFGEN